jgi:hypothetical protein
MLMRTISARLVLALGLHVSAVGAICAQQQARGAEGQSSLVYSDSTSFWIDVPRGWVLDPESGRRDGVIVALYKHGESWRTGEAVMYASVITPKSGFNAVIPAAIRSDSANWAGQSNDLVFTARDSIRTISGAFAQLRRFQAASTKHFETVAYLQAEGRVWMLALAARSLAARDAASPDFLSLVKSYAPGPIRTPPY